MLTEFREQLLAISPIEWAGMLTGFLGVWWSIQEKVAAWPAYILCYAAYIYLSIDFGLKAFTALNLIFIVISLYGWRQWKLGQSDEAGAQHPSLMTQRARIIAGAAIIAVTLLIGTILTNTNEAYFPYWDAAACATALAAQWLLSRKKIETWLLWILSDSIYLGIFIVNKSWPTVLLFAAFIVLAAKGWRDWSRSIDSTQTN